MLAEILAALLSTHSLHTAYTVLCKLYSPYNYPIHTLRTLHTHPTLTLYTLYTHSIHTLHIPCTHPAHILHTPCTPSIHTCYTHPVHVFTPYTQPAYVCLPSSHPAHILHTSVCPPHTPYTHPLVTLHTLHMCAALQLTRARSNDCTANTPSATYQVNWCVVP